MSYRYSRVINSPSFIRKAKQVHGKKYRYNKVVYISSKEKVQIFCKKCKQYFLQTPNTHLSNHGCPYCVGVAKLTTIEFIKKSLVKHSKIYGYDKVVYINTSTKVKIWCNECKKYFYQLPKTHLKGHKCPACSYRLRAYNNTLSFYIFEQKASKVHNNKYLYNQDYVYNKEKIRITCPIHGDFKQTPNSHLNGHGCPSCSIRVSKSQLEILNLVSKITRLKFKQNIYLPELKGLELDIYNHRKKVAIEYNGEQHYFRYSTEWKFLKKEAILLQQKYDRKKKRLCKKLGIRLVIIPCYQWSSLKTTIEKYKYLREKL